MLQRWRQRRACCSRLGLFGNGCCGGCGPCCGYGGYTCNSGLPGSGGYPCATGHSDSHYATGGGYSSGGYDGMDDYVSEGQDYGAEMARQPTSGPAVIRTSSRPNTEWRPKRPVQQAQYLR